jgi:hypothetical protein
MGGGFHSKLGQIYSAFPNKRRRISWWIHSRRDIRPVASEGEIEGGAKFRGESSVFEKKEEWERGRRRKARLNGYARKDATVADALLHTKGAS